MLNNHAQLFNCWLWLFLFKLGESNRERNRRTFIEYKDLV